MNHAQLFNMKEPIVIKLFGLDAYQSPYNPNPFIKGELAVGHQWKQLEKGKAEAEAEYEKLNGLEWTRKATAADFQPWFEKVDRLLMLTSGFRDNVGEKVLMKQLENVSEVYRVLTGEAAPDQLKDLGTPPVRRSRADYAEEEVEVMGFLASYANSPAKSRDLPAYHGFAQEYWE
ncbi:hypothetical protein EDB92DRAFT_1949146 [Lactarius akahatsu]|uniref:Uncharacterized protein n=1 Tax=Lactarius akahatsu TaxID=416441 RepID=A0AAD4LAC1_9AGAM|nr:hypothetical protein EDB92DRAFT_1949146 [Lactarius akahatsu]